MPILVKTRTLCSVPSSLVQLRQWWKRAAYVSYCAHLWMCTATLLQTLRVSFCIVFPMVWDNGIARFVHVFCTPTQGTSYSSIRAMKPLPAGSLSADQHFEASIKYQQTGLNAWIHRQKRDSVVLYHVQFNASLSSSKWTATRLLSIRVSVCEKWTNLNSNFFSKFILCRGIILSRLVC